MFLRPLRAREGISLALSCVDVTLFLLVMTNLHGPFRFGVGLVFGLFGPGWAIIGLTNIRDPALELGLTLATGLAALMLCAQVLMTIHQWHLAGFAALLALVCLASHVWQAHRFIWLNRIQVT